MEQIKEINGLTVYVCGEWFEINLPHEGGVMYSGACLPDIDPQRIYDYCFPLLHKGLGRIHEGVTLFFDRQSEINSIRADHALLAHEFCGGGADSMMCLWYSTPRSTTFRTVTFRWEPKTWPRRPRIIMVKGHIILPTQVPTVILDYKPMHPQSINAERPVNPALLDAVTGHLDVCGIEWAEM